MLFVVIIFLGSLLFLSIAIEIPKIERVINRFPTLSIFIPNWSFFAPIPGMFDYTLWYRYVSEDSKLSSWNKVLPPKQLKKFSFLWNPHKKFYKAIFDMISELMIVHANSDLENKESLNSLRLSLPYLHILNYINGKKHPIEAKQVQFMIKKSSRLFEEDVLFQSEPHDIG